MRRGTIPAIRTLAGVAGTLCGISLAGWMTIALSDRRQEPPCTLAPILGHGSASASPPYRRMHIEAGVVMLSSR